MRVLRSGGGDSTDACAFACGIGGSLRRRSRERSRRCDDVAPLRESGVALRTRDALLERVGCWYSFTALMGEGLPGYEKALSRGEGRALCSPLLLLCRDAPP